MNCHNGNAVLNPLVRLATALALALLLGVPAFAVDAGDIVVSSLKGDVRVTMNGAARDVRAGSVLELPATVTTGGDGAIELRQGATSVSVGPDTRLEFPALEKRGAPVDRIVQPRGNAFYDIGKRAGRKLRVETPYLVGVIKGTQFNVAAQEDSTTISLFEGRLEVLGGDGSAAVDLRAGEIASRHRDDDSISVGKMNEKAPATAPVSQNRSVVRGSDGDTMAGLAHNAGFEVASEESQFADGLIAGPIVLVEDPVTVSAAVDVETDVRDSIDVGGGVLSVDAVPDTSIDLGDSAVGVDAGAGVDVGVAIDAGADLAANLGSGAIDVDTAVDVSADVVGVDTGVSAGVDVGAGTIDLGVNVGDVDVDLGVDLGLDDGNNGHGNDPAQVDPGNPGNGPPATPGSIVEDVGGLLDGLLRRPGRR